MYSLILSQNNKSDAIVDCENVNVSSTLAGFITGLSQFSIPEQAVSVLLFVSGRIVFETPSSNEFVSICDGLYDANVLVPETKQKLEE